MADDWFLIPATTHLGGAFPDYIQSIDGIDGWSGELVPNPPNNPNDIYVCRVYGTNSALSTLANQQGVARDPTQALDVLNDHYGASHDRSDWESMKEIDV